MFDLKIDTFDPDQKLQAQAAAEETECQGSLWQGDQRWVTRNLF